MEDFKILKRTNTRVRIKLRFGLNQSYILLVKKGNFTYKMNNNTLIKSPLNYVGGKFKLLSQILPLFPDNINRFVDLFCGGGNIGVNVKANKIIWMV